MLPYRDAKVAAYSALLVDSFRRVTGREILGAAADLAAALWYHQQPLVSHGTQADPVFCYANAAALQLWQMDWDDFIRLPSRRSAEASGSRLPIPSSGTSPMQPVCGTVRRR